MAHHFHGENDLSRLTRLQQSAEGDLLISEKIHVTTYQQEHLFYVFAMPYFVRSFVAG